MSDSSLPSEPSPTQTWEEIPSSGEAPQFGAVDIVEAFTAMRHEWRGQTKESRALAEQIEATAANLQALEANLQSLEGKLLAGIADNLAGDAAEAQPLVSLLVETDHQLSRAVAAIAQWETHRRSRECADLDAAQRYFAGMHWLARRFARPLLEFIAAQRSAQPQDAENPAVEGLNLVLARLRRAMHEHRIERIDVEGQPFDAETMHAIGTVATTDCPSGHVAQQLSPAYRWRGKLLRYADVRVAT